MTKTVLLTGATDGIGKQAAIEIAQLKHHLILHGRNEEKLKDLQSELKTSTNNDKIDYVVADFSSLQEVQDLADAIFNRYKKINVLINNAGVFEKQRKESKDGYELTFAVNHLAHFLLTTELLPLLEESAPSRIVNVASQGHSGGYLDFDDLMLEKSFTGVRAYANSKLANILFTNKLARMLDPKKVTANSLHPGVINTKLLRAGWGYEGSPISSGAKTVMYVAFSEELKGVTGKYYSNKSEAVSNIKSRNVQDQDNLWEASLQIVKPISRSTVKYNPKT
ncbi:MAG: SDR family oxidoreductase [Candidatus Hodarchaeales archaeon]